MSELKAEYPPRRCHPETQVEWYISKATRLDNGCLISHLLPNGNGYPLAPVSKGRPHLHRFIYSILIGHVPEGMLVCHSCDEKRCIEVGHLYVGTSKNNTQDRIERNRWGNKYYKGGKRV